MGVSVYKSSEEIEKEAEGYSIKTFADILRALKAHPEWLEELRKIILTTELLELPRKFDELIKRVDKIEKDVDVLKKDVEVLKKDVAYLKGEFGRFKGKDFERTIREKFYAYFGRVLRKARRLEDKELIPLLEQAEEEGKLAEDQFVSLLELDLVVEGEIKATKKPVVLAVEISYSLYEKDLERAIERADLLAGILKKEVIPTVVAVEVKKEVEELAEEKGVLLIKAQY
ncbi:MAG: hypothetical protein ABWJ99_06630 [Caldimicrobium sp.]